MPILVGNHDSLAEWSKALASGASPQGRGFEPHSCHGTNIFMLVPHVSKLRAAYVHAASNAWRMCTLKSQRLWIHSIHPITTCAGHIFLQTARNSCVRPPGYGIHSTKQSISCTSQTLPSTTKCAGHIFPPTARNSCLCAAGSRRRCTRAFLGPSSYGAIAPMEEKGW